jgi:hypothetical protein
MLEERLLHLGGLLPLDGKLFTPVSKGAMTRIEKRVGFKLPELYRQFIAIFGASVIAGFITIKPKSKVPDRYLRKGRVQFTSFFGARSSTYQNCYYIEWQLQQLEGGLIGKTLPIADAGSSIICMRSEGPKRHTVWLADFDLMPDIEQRLKEGRTVSDRIRQRHFHLLADSFFDLATRMKNTYFPMGVP